MEFVSYMAECKEEDKMVNSLTDILQGVPRLLSRIVVQHHAHNSSKLKQSISHFPFPIPHFPFPVLVTSQIYLQRRTTFHNSHADRDD